MKPARPDNLNERVLRPTGKKSYPAEYFLQVIDIKSL